MMTPYVVNGISVKLFYRQRGGALYYCFWHKGKRYRNSTDAFNERDARIVARKAVAGVFAEKGPASPFTLMKLSELVQLYLDCNFPEAASEDEERPKRSTALTAKSRLGQFVRIVGKDVLFGAMTFDEARATVNRFIDERKREILAKNADAKLGHTLNSDRLLVSRLCSFVTQRTERGAWMANPAAAQFTSTPQTESDDPAPLDEIETDIIVTAARECDIWPLVLLGLGVGTRPAEGIRAEWADVDFENHVLTVLNKKARNIRPRHPVMSKWVEIELKAWREIHKADVKVWTLHHDTAFDMMAALRDRLGLPPHVTLQGLRATACTRAILSGMRLADYVLQFGHTLEIARRHYLKFGKMELADRRDQIEAAMFKSSAS